MDGPGSGGEQLQLARETDEWKWLKLEELSSKERALARDLDEIRAQLYEHARAMKRARVASVQQIADRLDRNRQRVNAWMRHPQPPRQPEKTAQDAGSIDPEAHVPL